MISFENTEVAFKSKSDKDLKRAYRLFKLVGSPAIVKFGKWATNLALALRLPINGIIKKTIFRQFCGGETIAECEQAIQTLGQFGIGTILDYSVEGKTSEDDFDETVQEIIRTIDRGANDPNIPFAVFKLTGIARFSILERANTGVESLSGDEQREYAQLHERVDLICRAAFERKVPVFIDAEDSWIQDTIDRLAFEMITRYNAESAIVYNTIQMYRHDRLAYLSEMIEAARAAGVHYGVKLVRGAYMEKERERAAQKGYPSPIQPDKEATDRDFDRALELLVTNMDCIAFCAGTHNEKSSAHLASLIEEHKLEKTDTRIYFAQLLGMSDHISFNLSNASYNVAKYVPYGPVREVMPYLLRRADENTSVAGQTGRELSLIIKERNRRARS